MLQVVMREGKVSLELQVVAGFKHQLQNRVLRDAVKEPKFSYGPGFALNMLSLPNQTESDVQGKKTLSTC